MPRRTLLDQVQSTVCAPLPFRGEPSIELRRVRKPGREAPSGVSARRVSRCQITPGVSGAAGSHIELERIAILQLHICDALICWGVSQLCFKAPLVGLATAPTGHG